MNYVERELDPKITSAYTQGEDPYPMPSVACGRPAVSDRLYTGMQKVDVVPPELYARYDVKRGLRNADGTGVLVGLTTISNVHGYTKKDGQVVPDKGDLFYRGYHVADLVEAAQAEERFGYEEVAYLLLTGDLPRVDELDDFKARIGCRRQLPEGYLNIFPRTTKSTSIMNVLQRATLLLYAYDAYPDDTSPTHEIDVALSLLGRWPRVASVAHQAYLAERTGKRLIIPPARVEFTMAETVLDVLRGKRGFTRDEALLLDAMLMLHAEHGGGNNSTFTVRVLSSSGTDAYSAYAAALGSLKGPKHGGANAKAGQMVDDAAVQIANWESDDEIMSYLVRILQKDAFDKSGLIYGIGHAVYTLSDPRAQIIKGHAKRLALQKGEEYVRKFEFIERIERLAPQVVAAQKQSSKKVSANIDLYTGFIYDMLDIPADLFTPIFAIARMAGWAAHRMEELYGPQRIIRPAYNSYFETRAYVPLAQR